MKPTKFIVVAMGISDSGQMIKKMPLTPFYAEQAPAQEFLDWVQSKHYTGDVLRSAIEDKLYSIKDVTNIFIRLVETTLY